MSHSKGGREPKVSDEVLLEAVAAWGVCEATRRLGYRTASALSCRMKRIKARGGTKNEFAKKILEQANEKVNRIQELLDNSSIKPENTGRVTQVKVREWGAGGFNKKTGEWEEHGLYGKEITMVPDDATPKFPLIKAASAPTQIIHAPAPRILHKVKYAVVLSDAQIGFLRNPKTLELTPTHDRRALEVARRIVADVGPSIGVGIGDWMDWPVFSRYTMHPEYFATCNESIQEGFDWKAAFVAAAPIKCQWTEIGSNHQARPEKFVLEHNMMAMGVERAKIKDQAFQEEWGVFSEPYLLRYQELGIQMSGQYPGGEYEFLPGFMAMHAPPKKSEFAADVVHGHLTPVTMNTNVIYTPKSRDVYHTYGIGGMMSLTANPDKKSIHASLVPSFSMRNNGAQSIMVVEYTEGKIPKHQPYIIHIRDGSAQFMGASYNVEK